MTLTPIWIIDSSLYKIIYLYNVFYLHATWSVAFLLLTNPWLFVATHQYTPSSLPLTAPRKNKDPSGSKMRWAWGSPCELVWTNSPSLNHSIASCGRCPLLILLVGMEKPPSWLFDPTVALQFSVTGSSWGTVIFIGCSSIRGAKPLAEKKNKEKLYSVHILSPWIFLLNEI